MAAHREIDHTFFSAWTAAMAYVLGFFAADGTMIANKRGGHYIEFHITERELLGEVQRLMASNHTIGLRSRDPRWKMGYRLQIGSLQMFSDLTALGFTPNKSKSLMLPAVPKELVGEFVRGYFDGDGCVYFNLMHVKDRKNARAVFQTKFTSGCKPFLLSFLSLLREHGIRGGFIVDKPRAYELALSHKDSLAIYDLMYNNAETCGVYLERKKVKFEYAIQHMYTSGRSSTG